MGDEFELEPSTPVGEIPDKIITELRECRRRAKDFAQAFSEAVKAQAEKYGIAPGALRKYVCALEDDTVERVADETADLERLLGVE